jgi:regulatory protein
VPRKSPASAGRRGRGGEERPTPPPGSAYAAGLRLLAGRELSEAQRRTRLARRGYDEAAVDDAVQRLREGRALDDRRVAEAAARLETTGRLRGRARVLQKLRSLGVARDTADAAVKKVYEDVDEEALLDRAILRRLRGREAAGLDRQAAMKVAAALARQGFSPGAVLARLRALGSTGADDA